MGLELLASYGLRGALLLFGFRESAKSTGDWSSMMVLTAFGNSLFDWFRA